MALYHTGMLSWWMWEGWIFTLYQDGVLYVPHKRFRGCMRKTYILLVNSDFSMAVSVSLPASHLFILHYVVYIMLFICLFTSWCGMSIFNGDTVLLQQSVVAVSERVRRSDISPCNLPKVKPFSLSIWRGLKTHPDNVTDNSPYHPAAATAVCWYGSAAAMGTVELRM